jgi:hypothetical protein
VRVWALLLLGAAACTDHLGPALAERLAARGLAASVVCKGGACIATETATGKQFAIATTVEDGRVVEWHPLATIVDTRQLSRDVSAQRRGWAAVGCERDVMVLAKDEATTCVLWDLLRPRLLAVTATGEPAHPLRWAVITRH